MHFSKIAAPVFAAGLATAAPHKRATEVTDADILQYALTLEHLENTFYREGLKQFDEQAFADAGFDSTFYENVKRVGSDEKAHVDFLSMGLKGRAFHSLPPLAAT